MELRAAVEYWQTKSRQHDDSRIAWGKASAWVTAIGLVALLFLRWWLFPDDLSNDVMHPSDYAKLIRFAGVLTLFAVVWIWALRVLVRLFLTNAHLQSDADERVTMVKTFLAMKNDEAVKSEELKIVLQAIFRPAAITITDKDALPLEALQALNKK